MSKAIGIARQSKGDDASKSIEAQVARIRDYCASEGFTLVDVHEERDVSGGTPLAKRDGLRSAVEAVERGEASVVVVAYFDRLVRSLEVQAEVVNRVETAGGRVLTLDVGEVSNATAGSWLSGSMLGLVAEYHRRTTKERVAAAQAEVVASGRWCGGRSVPFGYIVDTDGRLVVFPDHAELERRVNRATPRRTQSSRRSTAVHASICPSRGSS